MRGRWNVCGKVWQLVYQNDKESQNGNWPCRIIIQQTKKTLVGIYIDKWRGPCTLPRHMCLTYAHFCAAGCERGQGDIHKGDCPTMRRANGYAWGWGHVRTMLSGWKMEHKEDGEAPGCCARGRRKWLGRLAGRVQCEEDRAPIDGQAVHLWSQGAG